MSAEIIQFMPRPKRRRVPSWFPANAFRPAARPDDFTMDHTDTSPCECVPANFEVIRIEDG